MEREPFAPSVSDGKHRVHPRWLAAGLRTVLAALLTPAALASNAHAMQPAPAQQERTPDEIEHLLREMPQTDVARLIRLLDEPWFRIRQAADQAIRNRACAFIREHEAFPPWFAQLATPPGASPEVQRRLEALRSDIAIFEREYLPPAVHCEFPRESMTVRDLLRHVSQQIRCPVEYYGLLAHADETVRVQSGDLWSVLRGIHLTGGKRFTVTVSQPTGIQLSAVDEAKLLTASHGPLFAALSVDNAWLVVHAEPPLEMRSWKITGLRERKPDGTKEILHWTDASGQKIHLPDSVRAATDPLTLEVDITFSCNRFRRFDVPDVGAPAVIRNGADTLRFGGLARQANEYRQYAAALTSSGGSIFALGGRITASGRGARGESIPIVHTIAGLNELRWWFAGERPEHISVFIPRNVPDSALHDHTRTFVFTQHGRGK